MADDLTDDEFTVLLIAEQGESMMPIGRWEKSVESLVQKGFLQRHDNFNNTITEKGREAVKLRDAKDSHDLLTLMNKAAIESKSLSQKLPALINEIATFIERWPHWDGSSRVRIAVTAAEMEEFRRYVMFELDGRFYGAVRGVPLIVEEHPTDPAYVLENLK